MELSISNTQQLPRLALYYRVAIIDEVSDSTSRLLKMATTSNQNCDIDIADVDTRWAFRAGYPRLCRQPVVSRALPNGHPIFAEVDFQELRRRVKEIINEHNITLRESTWDNMAHPIQISYRGYIHELDNPSNQTPIRLTIHCLYDKEANKSVTWAAAVPKIYKVMKQLASPLMGVELYDYEYMKYSKFCEIPRADLSLVSDWEREGGYREKVLEIFESYPQMWHMMLPIGLGSKGLGASDHNTVLLLNAINAEDDRWAEIQDKIQSILPDKMRIELRQSSGPCSFYNSSSQSLYYQDMKVSIDKYSRPPKPGCEISPQTGTERQNLLNKTSTAEADFLPGGTMGGFVTTQNEKTGMRTTYGLTNGHVALSPCKCLMLP